MRCLIDVASRRPRRWLFFPIVVGLALVCATPSAAVEWLSKTVAGQAYLVVHRKSTTGVEVLATPALARAKDLLQLGYVSAGKRFGIILSVDGRGVVTLHSPVGHRGDSRLAPGGLTFVPQAFELDDAPDFERFFFVTADVPIDVEAVLAAGYALGRDHDRARNGLLNLASFLSQSSFLVQKPPAAAAHLGPLLLEADP